MKRIIALFLSVLMLASMMPSFAMAEEDEGGSSIEEQILAQAHGEDGEEPEAGECATSDGDTDDEDMSVPEPATEKDADTENGDAEIADDSIVTETSDKEQPTEDEVLTDETITISIAKIDDVQIVDGTAELVVEAAVTGTATVSYQWQQLDVSVEYENDADREAAWQDVDDATARTDTLKLSGITAENYASTYANLVYRCVVTAGESTAVSNEVKLLADAEWMETAEEFMDDATDTETEAEPAEETEEQETSEESATAETDLLDLDEPISGTCGDNLTWILDTDGTLTISGEGAMDDYDLTNDSEAPWYEYAADIQNIIIGGNVTTIGNGAFCGCNSLITVKISDGVVSIGNFAFDHCYSLADINIPDSVESIGRTAFRFCESLTTINLPEAMTLISANLFWGCSALTDIILPNKVTHIEGHAFLYCVSLKSIVIPDSVVGIGIQAFEGCNSLVDVYYRGTESQWNSLQDQIGELNDELLSATIHCAEVAGTCGEKLTWTLTENGVLIISGTGEMDKYTISSAPWYAYKIGISSVIIKKGVASIGNYAFRDCNGLTAITIPDSVTSIGEDAFAYCTGLTSVIIPSSVTSIEDCAFYGCFSLKSLVMPMGINYGERPYDGCTGLTEITLTGSGDMPAYKDSRTEEGLFYQDTPWYVARANSLTVNLPEGLTSIGDYAFRDCEGLTSITIPNSVTCIGSEAFFRLDRLTSITIPDGVTSIGSRAFYGCSGLTSIIIPNSVSSIGSRAFECCNGLKSLTMPLATRYGECTFQMCRSLTKITLTGSGAIYMPASYSYTPWYESRENSLTIDLPGGLTSIEDNTFFNCTGLTNVNFDGTQEEWDAITIGSNNTALISATLNIIWDYSAKVEPTCLDAGQYAYYRYRKTGKLYTDKQFTQELLEEDLSIPATGHTPAVDTAVETNYFVTGATEGSHCSVCGEVLMAQETVARKGVQGIKVTLSGTVATIKWTKVTGAKGYEVYRATSEDGEYTKVATIKSGTTVSYKNTKLTPGCHYYYKVVAYNSAMEYSGYSDVATITTAMAKPVVTVKRSGSTVTLTWKKITGAGSYTLYRDCGNGFEVIETEAPITALKYVDSVDARGTYSYYVVAESAAGVTAQSATVKSAGSVKAPTLTVTLNGLTGVTVKWTAVVGAKEYRLYVNAGDADQLLATVSGGEELVPLTYSVSPTGSYVFWLETELADAEDGLPTTAVVVIPATSRTVKITMAAPNVTAKKISVDSIKLTWKKVSYATNYEVQRATSKEGPFEKIGDVPALITKEDGTIVALSNYEYIDIAVPGDTYYYRVVSVYDVDSDIGASPVRNASAVRQVKLAFSAPTVTQKRVTVTVKDEATGINTTSKVVKLSWKAITGATSYEVYRCLTRDGTYELIGEVTECCYIDQNVMQGGAYYYKVKAVRERTDEYAYKIVGAFSDRRYIKMY